MGYLYYYQYQNQRSRRRQLERIDGLLIPGGYDVNPLFYHESCQFELDISDSKKRLL